jgi:hypothetical protein
MKLDPEKVRGGLRAGSHTVYVSTPRPIILTAALAAAGACIRHIPRLFRPPLHCQADFVYNASAGRFHGGTIRTINFNNGGVRKGQNITWTGNTRVMNRALFFKFNYLFDF